VRFISMKGGFGDPLPPPSCLRQRRISYTPFGADPENPRDSGIRGGGRRCGRRGGRPPNVAG
jgi:hypothetical protein